MLTNKNKRASIHCTCIQPHIISDNARLTVVADWQLGSRSRATRHTAVHAASTDMRAYTHYTTPAATAASQQFVRPFAQRFYIVTTQAEYYRTVTTLLYVPLMINVGLLYFLNIVRCSELCAQ